MFGKADSYTNEYHCIVIVFVFSKWNILICWGIKYLKKVFLPAWSNAEFVIWTAVKQMLPFFVFCFFPVAFLLHLQAPPGLKKNLLRTYESWTPEQISKGFFFFFSHQQIQKDLKYFTLFCAIYLFLYDVFSKCSALFWACELKCQVVTKNNYADTPLFFFYFILW